MTFRKSPGIALPSIHNVSLRFSAPVLVTRGTTLHLRERRSNGKRCDKYTQSIRIDLTSFCLPFQKTHANDGNQAGQHCRFFCIYSNAFCPFELLIAQYNHLFSLLLYDRFYRFLQNRLFLFCSVIVAHRQFSGEYPLSLSILSIVNVSE